MPRELRVCVLSLPALSSLAWAVKFTMGEWLHNCMPVLLSLPTPVPSQIKPTLEMHSFCLGCLSTQKSQEDACLQVSKFLIYWYFQGFSQLCELWTTCSRSWEAQPLQRGWQQSAGLLLQRLILLSHFQTARLTHMLSWQWVRSYDSQWNKHDR